MSGSTCVCGGEVARVMEGSLEGGTFRQLKEMANGQSAWEYLALTNQNGFTSTYQMVSALLILPHTPQGMVNNKGK